ncbi:MAG: hypothetical protein HQL78_13275 [Magnetococcales bacterium]|nr:hypothetical protein [Magnetococcales bacterium]
MIQNRNVEKKGWTDEQRLRLADGLRDLEADQVLVELKMTESLNDDALMQILIYDHLYLKAAKLERNQLRSIIISSITSRKEFLARHSCKPVGPAGI